MRSVRNSGTYAACHGAAAACTGGVGRADAASAGGACACACTSKSMKAVAVSSLLVGGC